MKLLDVSVTASRAVAYEPTDGLSGRRLQVALTLEFAEGVEPDTAVAMEALLALREYLEEWEVETKLTSDEKVDRNTRRQELVREVLDFPAGPGHVEEGEPFEAETVPLNMAEPVAFQPPNPEAFVEGLRAAMQEARQEDLHQTLATRAVEWALGPDPFGLPPEDTDEEPSAASLLSDNYTPGD